MSGFLQNLARRKLGGDGGTMGSFSGENTWKVWPKYFLEDRHTAKEEKQMGEVQIISMRCCMTVNRYR